MGQVLNEIMDEYEKHGWDKVRKEHKCFSCSKSCQESLITGMVSWCPQYRNINHPWARFVRWIARIKKYIRNSGE